METKSIGALWKRTSKKGIEYLAGDVKVDGQVVKIIVFENSTKKESKHPDYRVFLSEPREAPKEAHPWQPGMVEGTVEDPF